MAGSSLRKTAQSFVVGSSISATIVSLSYIGNAYLKHTSHPIRYEYMAVFIPVLFGVVNALLYVVHSETDSYGDGSIGVKWMIATGFLFGIALSHLGTYGFSMPTEVFGFTDKTWFVPLLVAPFLYALIWAGPVHWTNTLFLNT